MTVNEESNELIRIGEAQTRTAADVLRHVKLIEEVSKAVMKDGTHFGTIPGCGPKPTLLKPGAEKLLLTFGLSTTHEITQRDLGGGHREYEVVTAVRSGDRVLAEGLGTCSTMERKYRYRSGARKCPTCAKERTLIQTKSGRNPGGYWCVPDKGGCNGNFLPGDKAIEGQVVGSVDNVDLADTYNTVLKMAKKRSLVDGALTSTAASDFFAQDLEELELKDAEYTVKEEKEVAKKPKPAAVKETAATTTEKAATKDVEIVSPKPATSSIGATVAEIADEAEAKPAAAVGELKSWRGLSLTEWKALSEEQRSAAGDISRKQAKVIFDLAKTKGITDEALIIAALKEDFSQEFREFGITSLWQIKSSMASFAIDSFKQSTY